jgi:hypothetical protein
MKRKAVGCGKNCQRTIFYCKFNFLKHIKDSSTIMMKLLLILSSISFLVSLQSCSEQVGCIDSRAINYDPAAETASNDCRYPSLAVEFDFKLGNQPFEINRIYNINGYNTAFKEFHFYVSKVQLTRSDQTTVDFETLYPLMSGANTSFSLGDAYLETYERITFNIGVDSIANRLISNYINDSNHPLQAQSPDTMHFNLNEGYIFLKMVGKVDRNGDGIPNENEAFDFRIGSNSLLQAIDLPLNKTLSQATEVIQLEMDIEVLLNNIDLQIEEKTWTSDNFILAAKIANNIPGSILIP